MSKSDYEARKAAMLEDIRAVMDDVEALYNKGVEEGSEEIEDLKTRLGDKLEAAKEKLSAFESDTAANLRRHSARAKKKFREFEDEASEQIKRRDNRLTKRYMINPITPWVSPHWPDWWSAYC